MKPTLMKYNPAFLSQDELIKSFVVRRVDLELIIETIKENTGNSNQHVLIIGPRGMGKTMLVLRTAASIAEDKKLNSQWYPIVFSEESYEVSTPAEFWLRAIFHLGKQTKSENLQRAHERLKTEKDEKRLSEGALSSLMDFADEQGKRLLLVVENINMIFEEQISSDGSWDIRHTLLNEPRLMLLGTATSRFDEIDNAEKAMFDLFKIQYLEPLDTQDSKLLWESLTGEVVEENKIRPIHILTGGNPRLLAIISSFAVGASFRELMEQLTSLIDEYTTYFKSNIEALPSLERKVFVTLANIWEPADSARVARDARLDVNKTSSLLKRLESRGCVSVLKSAGRKKSYQVAERLYNIYHLMRLSGSRSNRVRAVVDFMISFYEGDALAKKLAELTEDACCLDPAERRDHLEAYRAILNKVRDPNELRRIIYSTKEFLSLPDVSESLNKMIDQSKPDDSPAQKRSERSLPDNYKEGKKKSIQKNFLENPKDTHDWVKHGLFLQEISNKPEEAENAFRRAIEIDVNNDWAWVQLGEVLHENLDRYEEAEAAYRKAIEINPNYAWTWAQLGQLLHDNLERYDEAETAYRKAIEINPKYAWTWAQLGQLMHEELERYDEAETAYRKAIEINSNSAWTWTQLGQLLHKKLNRYDEAETAYRKAIEINSNSAWTWGQLGKLLHEELERYDEAETAYRKAIEINSNYAWAWAQLGKLLHEELERYDEAETAYRKAIEIDKNYDWAWAQLGQLLHEELERYDEAETAYRKAIEIDINYARAWVQLGQLLYEELNRCDEAETAYRKAIEIDKNYDWAWAQLGQLLHEKLERYDEAETAYRKAIEIDKNYAWAWAQLGQLLHEKSERYEEAETAYRKVIEIDKNYAWAWAQLGQLLHEKSERYEEAETAYRKVIEIYPKNNGLWVILGNLLHAKLERYPEAETAYRKAIEIDPNYAWVWIQLGELLHKKLERYEEAEIAYRKAIEIEVDHYKAWAQLVKLQIEQSVIHDNIIDTITQYLEITHRSAQSLNNIAWVIFETDFKDGFLTAEKMAQEAVEKEPDSIYYQHTYASILGAQGKWEKALSIAAGFLKDHKAAKQFPHDIISFFILAAASGYVEESLKLLKNSACAPYMEPLIVALQMLAGEKYNAPHEVVEVAKDVLKRIDEKANDRRRSKRK